MKGYYTSTCYMGWIPRFGQFIKFSTEEEYKEFFRKWRITMTIPVINLPMTGAKIDSLRKKANISVKEIQEVYGIESTQAIYKWIHGRNLPTVDKFIIIAEIFDVTVDDILSIDYREIKEETNNYV